MSVDFAGLRLQDVLVCGGLVVCFGGAFLADKKGETRVWQLAEAIFLGLYGIVGYFFPVLLMGYLTVGKTDPLHVYLGQTVGASLFSMAVVSFLQCRANSSDRKVRAGWLLSRVVGFTFMLVAAIYSQASLAKQSTKFSSQRMSFSILVFGLMLAGCFVKLWQHQSPDHHDNRGPRTSSTGGPGSGLNRHFMINMAITLPSIVMYIVAPSFMMDAFSSMKYDGVHEHFLRLIGLTGLTSLLHTLTAFQYEREADKKDFFIGQIVVLLMILVVKLLNQYKHSLTAVTHFYPALVLIGVQLANCVYAAFFKLKAKEQ